MLTVYNKLQMNCIIIDDEALARAIINQKISKHSKIKVLGEFSNGIEAIKYLNQNKVDVIFLDIHMPDFTGFEFIQTLKNLPKVILITSDKNIGMQAFEYDCIIDYLLKPISDDRFKITIQKLKASKIINKFVLENNKQIPTDTNKEFYINIGKRLIKIEFNSVNVVEAKGDYILIKTENKNYTVHSTLKKILDKLPSHSFLKVHRSFIINTKKIIDIEDNSVLIAKDVIPVSRSNRAELISRLNLL